MNREDVFYKSIIDKLPAGYSYKKIITENLECPQDIQYIDVNSAFEEIIGLTKEFIIGKLFSQIFNTNTPVFKDLISHFQEIAIKGKYKEIEFFSEYNKKWYQINSYSPEKGYVISLYNEITLLKKIEDRISDTENKYKRIVETSNEGILITDKNNTITFVNEHMADMLNYTKEKIIGNKLHFLYFDDDLNSLNSKIEERKKGISEVFERKFKTRFGKAIWGIVSATPIYNKYNQFNGSFAMVTNITDRKLAEDSLLKKHNDLTALLNALDEIVILIDSDTKVLAVNDAYLRFNKMKRDEIIHKNLIDIIPNDYKDLIKIHFDNTFKNGKTAIFQQQSGGINWINKLYPIKDNNGKVYRVVILTHNEMKKEIFKIKGLK